MSCKRIWCGTLTSDLKLFPTQLLSLPVMRVFMFSRRNRKGHGAMEFLIAQKTTAKNVAPQVRAIPSKRQNPQATRLMCVTGFTFLGAYLTPLLPFSYMVIMPAMVGQVRINNRFNCAQHVININFSNCFMWCPNNRILTVMSLNRWVRGRRWIPVSDDSQNWQQFWICH